MIISEIYKLVGFSSVQANTIRWPSVRLMLAHRLQRWPNIKQTLGERTAFAGENVKPHGWHRQPYP